MSNKALSITLALIIVCAIVALVYIAVMPKVGESFTEFYILGPEGKAEGYPGEVALGEEARVIVGIINQEYRETSYRVEITIDGSGNNEVGPIVLVHGEKWEHQVSFRPVRVGGNQKVEFLLYKAVEAEPSSERLHLWIDVTE